MGTVVGPILQREKPRLMQIVWFTQSHKSAPLPILTPSPQLPESFEEGNLEPGPHQEAPLGSHFQIGGPMLSAGISQG